MHGLGSNSRRFNELLQVLDEVWQLRHLDVSLNDITRIEVSDGLQVLLESPIVLLLYGVKLVGILLANLSVDFFRELRVDSNSLRLLKHILLE